jgi:hypothetical protein
MLYYVWNEGKFEDQPEKSYPFRITSKPGNVFFNPFNSQSLIEETRVLWDTGIGKTRETENIDAVTVVTM